MFVCSAQNLASLLSCQVVASSFGALTKPQWMTASAPLKCWRYALRSGLVRSATMMPGTGLPSRVVGRTSIGTRSQRSASSGNMRWAT